MYIIILALAACAFVVYTFVHTGKVALFYVFKHLTLKQMIIISVVILLLVPGLPQAIFSSEVFNLLTTLVVGGAAIAGMLLLWKILFMEWGNAIKSGKQEEFLNKAETEYDEYKQAKREKAEKFNNKLNDFVNKQVNEPTQNK